MNAMRFGMFRTAGFTAIVLAALLIQVGQAHAGPIAHPSQTQAAVKVATVTSHCPIRKASVPAASAIRHDAVSDALQAAAAAGPMRAIVLVPAVYGTAPTY